MDATIASAPQPFTPQTVGDALLAHLEGREPATIGEALVAGLEGRRVLMLARDPGTAQDVETALRAHGVPVQMLTSEHDGFATERLDERHGLPVLPEGVVVLSDSSSWRSTMEALACNRAMAATISTIEASRAGSTTDIMLMVSAEDALEDCARTINRLMDQVVEARLRDDGLMPHQVDEIRPFARLVPDGYKFEMTDFGVRLGRGAGKALSVMDEIFGDDVIARERRDRMTIVCEARHDIDFDVVRVGLPAPGFDHRAVNEAFNRRTGGRGARGDRRTNRGGRGRR